MNFFTQEWYDCQIYNGIQDKLEIISDAQLQDLDYTFLFINDLLIGNQDAIGPAGIDKNMYTERMKFYTMELDQLTKYMPICLNKEITDIRSIYFGFCNNRTHFLLKRNSKLLNKKILKTFYNYYDYLYNIKSHFDNRTFEIIKTQVFHDFKILPLIKSNETLLLHLCGWDNFEVQMTNSVIFNQDLLMKNPTILYCEICYDTNYQINILTISSQEITIYGDSFVIRNISDK